MLAAETAYENGDISEDFFQKIKDSIILLKVGPTFSSFAQLIAEEQLIPLGMRSEKLVCNIFL